MPQQNNPRLSKCKRNGEDKGFQEVQLKKIYMQATKAIVTKSKWQQKRLNLPKSKRLQLHKMISRELLPKKEKRPHVKKRN